MTYPKDTQHKHYNRIFEISDGGNQNRFTALLRGTNNDIYESWGINGSGNVDFNTVFINFNEFKYSQIKEEMYFKSIIFCNISSRLLS